MSSALASRRQVIRLAVAGVAALCSCLPIISACERGTGKLDWDGFIKELTELSKSYLPGQVAEQSYVKGLTRLLEALDYGGRSVQDLMRSLQKHKTNAFTGAPVHETTEFEVVLFLLDEGQYFPYHNHPSMTGISMCVSGQVDVHNLDIAGKADPSTLLLRTSVHERMSSGRISWLTSGVRNIHRVQASKDSQLIDIFTPPYTPERVAQTRWYQVERLGVDKRLYSARLL
jgi:PCO_ADO